MTGPYFHGLSPAEHERLALLVEECAEVQQIAMKIMRHGYDSWNPNDPDRVKNRSLLENELGDLKMAMDLLAARDDVGGKRVTARMRHKYERVWKWLHHNAPRPGGIGYEGKNE